MEDAWRAQRHLQFLPSGRQRSQRCSARPSSAFSAMPADAIAKSQTPRGRSFSKEALRPGFGAGMTTDVRIKRMPRQNGKKPAPGPAFPYSIQGAFWKIQARLENGEAIAGKKLCWSPRDGLFLDSTPLAGGNLLITLSAPREEGAAEQDLASALITQSGAEFQILTY